MNEKTSSLFDNEIQVNDIDSLLSKKDRGLNVRESLQSYQMISDAIQGKRLSKNNLTNKIMAAIDKEPTQLSGFLATKESLRQQTAPSEYWPMAASFAALFVIGLTVFNGDSFKAGNNSVLAKGDIPEDIIIAHHASTSTNMKYFIKTKD